MPLLANRSYLSSNEQVQLVDKTDLYNLQNYHIRDDSEITSSDDSDINIVGSESEGRSYYVSERPLSSNAEAEQNCANTKMGHKGGSPFKRGMSSFFKRHESRDGSHNKDSTIHADVPELQKDGEVLDTTESRASSASSSSRFWRSWRLRHRRNDCDFDEITASQKQTQEIENNLDESSDKEDIKEKKEEPNDTTEEKVSDDFREYMDRDFAFRHQKAQPDIAARAVPLKGKFEAQFSESETSDEGNDDELGLSRCSNLERPSEVLPHMASPLTPVDEISVVEEKTVRKGSLQYKNIYKTPQDYISLEEQFDHLQVNKNSKTFFNLLSTLHLLNGPSQKSSNLSSLEEFTKTILSLVENSAKHGQGSSAENATTANNLMEFKSTIDTDTGAPDQVVELESELSLLRDKYEGKISDLYNCRKELKAAHDDLADARNEIAESDKEMSTLKTELNSRRQEWTELESALRAQLNEQADGRKTEHAETQKYMDNYEKLQSEHTKLEERHQCLLEQGDASRDKIHELIGIVSENDLKARKLQQANDRLQKELTDASRLATKAKSANKKLETDCRREHCKLLDCRRELEILHGQLELASCHKTESLQFMAQLMISFKDALCENSLQECDAYLESIGSNELFSCALLQCGPKINEQQWKEQASRQRAQIAEFYRHFAKKNLLDQIFAKYVSYMRSNRFLSQQLRGLRQQEHDHEEYISRLLQDCKSQRVLIAKQDHRISNLKKSSKDQKAELESK
ncbi:LAME_0F06810g1_1 [Lachancea meyersii CBS 8951]|uniref:LAME_0F06810g1_1 n=1 Tax=Lachancea meyersii CBS 8951 TaxID=1266667 RepID=A0A1G4JTP0_9SACH|nr:LAME_0F06810g1_1 [Lachancea meyersii CBS 8951]